MATKGGRAEIPDSEDEPMTSSPIEDDTGKLPANSSDSQQQTFQTRLQDVTCSHQATVEHVPDTVSSRAKYLVVEQDDPSKDVEMANTLPDNSLQQQHVTGGATSEKAKTSKEPETSEASRTSGQPGGSNSSGQPLEQSMQQEFDQGMGIDVEGVSKPISLHIDVPVGELRKKDSEPSKEVEVGEQKPEQITTSDLPGSEELESSASTQEPGPTTVAKHVPPPMEEGHAEMPQRMDIILLDIDVEQASPPEASGHATSVQDAEATSNTDLKNPPDPPEKQFGIQDSETNQLPQSQVPSPTKVTSGPDKPSPVKGSQEATVAELRAQRAALIASLAALPNIQELITEIEDDDDSSRGPYDGPTDAEVLTAANKIVKTHIKLLHEYNEMKDVGQGLMGLIADSRGVRIMEVQDEFGIDAKD
jgi:hypothetical protein